MRNKVREDAAQNDAQRFQARLARRKLVGVDAPHGALGAKQNRTCWIAFVKRSRAYIHEQPSTWGHASDEKILMTRGRSAEPHDALLVIGIGPVHHDDDKRISKRDKVVNPKKCPKMNRWSTLRQRWSLHYECSWFDRGRSRYEFGEHPSR